MTKGELDYESKKIRASVDKMPLQSGLYGQELGDSGDEGNIMKRKNSRPPPMGRFSKPATVSNTNMQCAFNAKFRVAITTNTIKFFRNFIVFVVLFILQFLK